MFIGYKLSIQKKFITLKEYLSFKGYTTDNIQETEQKDYEKLEYFKNNIPSKWYTEWVFKYM